MGTAHRSFIVKPLDIQALGDDFARVSGAWLQGTYVAQHLHRALRTWAFYAKDAGAAGLLIGSLSERTALHIIGIAPGMSPQWDESDRPALCRLLSLPEDTAGTVGLLLALAPPVCQCQRRNTRGCEGCDGCTS